MADDIKDPVTTPTFDHEALKRETLDAINAQGEVLKNTILNEVRGMMPPAPKPEPKKVVNMESFEEYKEEIEALGIEEAQAKALIKLISKAGPKAIDTKEVKKEIRTEIEEDNKLMAQKRNYDNQAAMKYPEIVNPKSALFKQAQIEYERLKTDDPALARSPRLAALAVEEAAAALGIAPLTKSELMAEQARNEGGSGGSQPKDVVTDKQTSFAASFGVDKDKFKEKLKLIHAKKAVGQ